MANKEHTFFDDPEAPQLAQENAKEVKEVPRFKFEDTEQRRLTIESVGFATEDLLRRKGWKHTSDTPGCFWMWEKKWKGKTLLVNEKFAVLLEEHLESER